VTGYLGLLLLGSHHRAKISKPRRDPPWSNLWILCKAIHNQKWICTKKLCGWNNADAEMIALRIGEPNQRALTHLGS
jgi:hypothetical protein